MAQHSWSTQNMDKEDGLYHSRTDPLTLISSKIPKSVQTYPLCIQGSSWIDSRL